MKRAGDAILCKIRQRFPHAVRQILHRNRCIPFADQRQIHPPLDVCAQNADVLQALRRSLRQQSVNLKQLRLHKTDYRIHQPVFFLNLRVLPFQLVLRPN